MPVPDSRVQRAYRVRVSLFLLTVSLALGIWIVGYQAIQTLRVLTVVERSRDRWQQAGPVIEALNLKEGSVVADVDSGAGYFTLKLALVVGGKGRVLAEDILKEPLAFLWIRALLRHQRNVHVIHGEPDNPHLPAGQVDTALIANTYHEFTHPLAVLNHVFQALHPEGRLVIGKRPVSTNQRKGTDFARGAHFMG